MTPNKAKGETKSETKSSENTLKLIDLLMGLFRGAVFRHGEGERPSPEPLLKKEESPAVLRRRELGKCSGSLGCLELKGFRVPSRTLEGTSRKS